MELNLPQPLTTYLNAEATTDVAALADCFAADAVVRDEGRTYQGLEAIQAWKRDAKAKYRYSVLPLEVSRDGATVKMRVRLTGPFPGSPVEVTYTFVLAHDKIASLEID
jgi:hypothetical protein